MGTAGTNTEADDEEEFYDDTDVRIAKFDGSD